MDQARIGVTPPHPTYYPGTIRLLVSPLRASWKENTKATRAGDEATLYLIQMKERLSKTPK
jgi:hypothetical protein